MRRSMLLIVAALACAAMAHAGEAVWFMPASITTSATARTSDCPGFVGQLDEVSVYAAGTATGVVSVALVDPYNSSTVTLATNLVITTSKKTWRPRVAAPAVSGAVALTITNSGDRIWVSGDTLRATLSGVKGTNPVIRFRAKWVE